MNKKYTGFVFGHYDSRGGTMFVIADDFDDAFYHYQKLFGHTAEDRANGEGLALQEDFLGIATLEGIDRSVFEHDLENHGRVLMLGELDEDGLFPSPEPEPARLLFQPAIFLEDNTPTWSSEIPEGYSLPTWNDDAYGFCVCLTDRAKKAKRPWWESGSR